MIHVTNYKLLAPTIKNDLKKSGTSHCIVYIGRRNNRHGLKASPLSNPFNVKYFNSPEECIKKYYEWLSNNGKMDYIMQMSVLSEIGRLKEIHKQHGELVLVCWCKKERNDDTPCHGDVIKEIIEMEGQDQVSFLKDLRKGEVE